MNVAVKGVSMRELPAVGRVMRRPQHPFNLRSQAFAIQPFLCAPVIPGETMKNLLLQSRVVTDPIVNPLIGWWKEYYFFYVKHRDLDMRDDLTEMALNPEWTADAVDTPTANPSTYHPGGVGAIDWVTACLKRVTEEYFRGEGEAWNNVLIGGLPAAAINGQSVFQSVGAALDLPADVDVDANADNTITAAEVDAAMRQWQIMKMNNLTDMTYEDFLATYGVRPKKEETHKPELLRYVRDWSYPTNTIDPASGAPSSALSWAVTERADKDRFFREPGFIFGVTVTRPKVYISQQKGLAAAFMNTPFSWLPALLADDPYTSIREFLPAVGPLDGQSAGYFVDMRDLLLYGEQFLNFTPDAASNSVALPTAGLANRSYPTDAMSKAFFKDTAAKYLIREDGIVSLAVAGRQIDYTN